MTEMMPCVMLTNAVKTDLEIDKRLLYFWFICC